LCGREKSEISGKRKRRKRREGRGKACKMGMGGGEGGTRSSSIQCFLSSFGRDIATACDALSQFARPTHRHTRSSGKGYEERKKERKKEREKRRMDDDA